MTLSEVLVAVDLEATGMEPGRDRIIEVGAVKFRGDQVLDRFESLVRPDRDLSLSIRHLTGLSDADLRDAPHVRDVGKRFRSFVGRAPLVGQSVDFDVAMLQATGLKLDNPIYDTFELATILLPDLPTYDLGTIAARLGIEVGDKHRAVADAETSMEVFNRLVHLIDEFDDPTLERLSDLTGRAQTPLSRVFHGVLRERRREAEAYGGMSIGAQLLASLGGSSAGPEAMFLVPRDRPERLEANENPEPLNPDLFKLVMGDEGPFARTLPGYEPREQQVEMMQHVAKNLNIGGQLLIEAGTGTGKSLAYLLPAALHAMRRGEPVVISTATIALQDQLLNKDIPALVEAANASEPCGVGADLSVLKGLRARVLKGRANYLCLRRWFLSQREQVQDPVEAELHAKITAWLHHTETGDRAELRLTPDEQRAWSRLAEDEGACAPAQCIFHRRNQCFLFRARHEAEAAHLIIVNHSLLLSDLLRGGSVLPRFGHLIIDEAQHLEDEVTRQASFSVSQAGAHAALRRVYNADEGGGGALGLAARTLAAQTDASSRRVAGHLQGLMQGIGEPVAEAELKLDRVFALLGEFATRRDSGEAGYERRVRLTPGVRADSEWTHIEIEWDNAATALDRVRQIVSQAAELVSEIDGEEQPAVEELATELELVDADLALIRERLYNALTRDDLDLIAWLTRHQTSGEVSVNAAPLHVDSILRDTLYPRLESLTLTSATLSTEGTFRFIRERLGLEDAEGVQVPSPFDYHGSTLVGVADDIPEPNQPGHQKQVQQALIQLCTASEGRAMILFTSHSALQNSYHAIKKQLEAQGILVLGQRIDGSPRQLIERLSNHPRTVLLGTNSFWEGVDIVGEALSLLVITRLPFSVPTDPIFAARSDLFDNPFTSYAVPQAILRFKQGFGRLIRSSTDRGVVAVLDRRVVSRGYGRGFLASLPETRVEVAPASRIAEHVREWLVDEAAQIEG